MATMPAKEQLLAGFNPLLHRSHIFGHLPAGFPAHHKRHQDLADPLADKVDADGQPAAGITDRLDQNNQRPYILLSCAMSVDGHIDDTSPDRLLLSNVADFDRVDDQRASADAILVGATTIRRDNPRLLVRCPIRLSARQDRGLPASPAKVTITGSGNLDPQASFFTAGGTEVCKLVYCGSPAVGAAQDRLRMAPSTSIIDAGNPVNLVAVVTDLSGRGVGRLMVEGGQNTHTRFLAAGLADELQLVIAPFFVGDPGAPRFVGAAAFPWHSGHRMTLAESRQIGDVVLLRYLLSPRALGEQRVAQATAG